MKYRLRNVKNGIPLSWNVIPKILGNIPELLPNQGFEHCSSDIKGSQDAENLHHLTSRDVAENPIREALLSVGRILPLDIRFTTREIPTQIRRISPLKCGHFVESGVVGIPEGMPWCHLGLKQVPVEVHKLPPKWLWFNRTVGWLTTRCRLNVPYMFKVPNRALTFEKNLC